MNKHFTFNGWKMLCCLLFGAIFFSTSLTAQSVLATRSVSNTTQCQNGNFYSFSIPIEGLGSSNSFQWASFTEFSDGTATLVGSLVNGVNPDVQFNVDVTFTGRTFTAPTMSPKPHVCESPSMDDWYYYTGISGTLMGVGQCWGTTINIISGAGPAFQIGTGANITNDGTSIGASAWLVLEVDAQNTWGPQIVLNPHNTDGGNGDINIDLSGQPLTPPGACDNVTSGGTISGNQTVCAGSAANTLTGTAPTGGSGTAEYLWLSSTTACPTNLNQQIAGATNATYNPGTLSQTTFFVRCARRAGCDSWTQGESNCLTVTVDSDPACNGGDGGGGDTTNDCSNITIDAVNGSIVVGGLDGAPVTSIQIFKSDWSQTLVNCFGDCDSPTQTASAAAGDYLVYVKYYSAGYALICEVSETVTVGGGGGGGGVTDNDNDGVPAGEDCNDNDASVPATVGSTCNDGNANTDNDVIQADGCTCAGTTDGGGGGNASVDIKLNINGDGAQVAPYTSFSVEVFVMNEGTSTSNNVVVSIPQPANVVFQGGNAASATQGTYDAFSTFNWTVGTLTPGQSETLTINYYALAGAPYTVYGQVQSASGTDTDSTPGNGTNPTPNEDDEAVYVTGGGNGNPSCDLNLTASVSGITCDNNGTPNNASDDTFTFNVTVSGGNPWGWTGGGKSGSMGQAVNFGPYAISAGNVGFTIVDNDNNACTVDINATPPATCSDGGDNPGGGGGDPDCVGITITTGDGTITVGGLDGAPITSVQIFKSDWSATILNCFGDCDTPTTTVNAPAGEYLVYVKYYTAGYAFICEKQETVTVGGGGGGPTGVLSLTCPNNVTVNAAPGANLANVNYPNPVWSTTCTEGGLSLSRIAGLASGDDFPLGTSTVTFQSTDNCGNSETCSFTVTVNGTNANLNISCPNNVTVNAAVGANSATATYSTPIANTTCAGGANVTRTAGPGSGSAFPVGTTTVTYQATDNCGNTKTCSFTVTVVGSNSNVTISCPANVSVLAFPGSNGGPVSYGNASANTDCAAGGLNVVVTEGPASGGFFSLGTTTVKYTATDACGGTVTCSFTVTVTPLEFPVIPCDEIDYTGLDYLGTFDGKDYYIKPAGDVDYHTAVNIASAAGGSLLTINSAAENTYISSLLAGRAWLGLSDVNVEGQFEWTNGEALSYTNWYSNQPDNAGGTEHYGEIHADGGWNDVNETRINWAVVEFPECDQATVCHLDVLFVVGNTTLGAGDAAIKNRLTAQGYNVMVEDAQWVTTSDANGKDLVLISSTVLSSDVNTKFKDVNVPVIVWESYLFDDMEMTGTTAGTSYGEHHGLGYTVASNHPINNGLTGTFNIYNSEDARSWGYPYAAANDVGYVPGSPNKCLIIVYDTGEEMYHNFHAPARRVGFFLRDNTATKLTAKGWRLFDQAVQWATKCTPSSNVNNGAVAQSIDNEENGAIATERTEEETSTPITFGIYPNPATTNVTVSLKEANGAAVIINIYDQLGRLVERTEVDAAYDSAYRINTADFTSGLYLISVQAGDAPAVTKQLVIMPN